MDDTNQACDPVEAALAESFAAIEASRVGEALLRLADAFRCEAEEVDDD